MYSTYMGGNDSDGGDGDDFGQAIAVDSAGNVYVTGHAGSGNFPIQNAFQSAFGGGDSDAFIAKFGVGQVQVTPSADTTTVSSSPSSSTIGQMVTFTATVTPTTGSTGTPTGTVTFEDGTTVLGSAPLDNGTATFSIATLAVGSHTITADYGGDTNFATSSGTTIRGGHPGRVDHDPRRIAQHFDGRPDSHSHGDRDARCQVDRHADGHRDVRGGDDRAGDRTAQQRRRHLLYRDPGRGLAYHHLRLQRRCQFRHRQRSHHRDGQRPDDPADSHQRGPRLTGVKRYGFHAMPTTVVLTFDQPLDPGSAEDVRNYVIVDPSGHRIRINRAVLDPTRLTVTLHPAQRISIHHPYQLIVNGAGPGAVSNMSGQPLDSEDAGQPGSSDHVVLTWRQLVLGDVSKAFRLRYGLVPKGPRAKIPSGVSSPKAALGNRGAQTGTEANGAQTGTGLVRKRRIEG